ncbi:hypothetical protein GCM10009665_70970 [Kitasatospora nipponensis]|uniref:PknH-like protein n=1 Tax=Kitasatospora nipponensis TaxID=258049 RepID=A0ABP4HLD9_9ACTN
MPRRRPVLPPPLTALVLAALVPAAGCATVGPAPAGDRVTAAVAPRALSAAELRGAAVTGSDLGAGYTVSLLGPGQPAPSGSSGAAQRQVADVPACQPVLDAVGPADPGAAPQAEADLSVLRVAAPSSAGAGAGAVPLYTALLGYPAGRPAVLQTTLDQALARYTAFTSAPADPKAVTPTARGARTGHQLERADAPTPEGADAVTAFTLTSGPATGEGGGPALTQRAVVVRVGTVLAVFSTVGTAKEPAAVPDPVVVRAQTRKLRAAQG